MMSRNFDPKLTPPHPSVMLKWVFYLHLHTECHKITYPPPPYLRDVIYEWSLTWMSLVEVWTIFDLTNRGSRRDGCLEEWRSILKFKIVILNESKFRFGFCSVAKCCL